MDPFYMAAIGSPGYGLVNQLYSLFNGIIIARTEHRPVVMCNDFNKDVAQNLHCPLGEVIDLVHLNNITTPLGVVVVDRTSPIQIVSVKYGTYHHFIDVTDEIRTRFMTNNELFIPQEFDLNTLKGDPDCGTRKNLIVIYEVNGTQYTCAYPEKRHEPIRPGYGQPYREHVANFVNDFNTKLFYDLIQQFRFTPQYYKYVKQFMDTIDSTTPISVIHFRNEADALQHWSLLNHMPRDIFELQLNQKYISIIQKYISPKEPLIVLTGRTNSSVIDFLKLNGYNYHLGQKDAVQGRECNAIIDLLVGKQCTKTFIGSTNPNKLDGSTFSHMLWICLPHTVKSVFLDLADINHDEYLKNSD